MIIAVAVLLFSALTSVGLLAIWAATSPWHWFVRTMLYLGFLSLLLLIPAYEPFVAFVLQGAVVAGGVQLARWWHGRNSGNRLEMPLRFKLRTIPLVMVPVAILVAVYFRLPELNYVAWQSVVLIGLGGGIATLIGLWITSGKILRWWVRAIIGLAMTVAVSFILVNYDQFVDTLVRSGSWPPIEALQNFFDPVPTYAEFSWPVILTCSCIWIAVTTSPLFRSAGAKNVRFWKWLLQQPVSTTVSGIMFLFVLIPSTIVFYRLSNPQPIPNDEFPSPNGYDDFLAATALLPKTPLVDSLDFDVDTATTEQLRKAVREVQPAVERARKGLSYPAWKHQDYTSVETGLPEIGALRSLARGLEALGVLKKREQDFIRAADIYLDLVKYGNSLGRGGVMVDDLVGIACAHVGYKNLYGIREQMPIGKYSTILTKLAEMDQQSESPENVINRERTFIQHAMGWSSHMELLLCEVVGDGEPYDGYLFAVFKQKAVVRLLQLEFALRVWRAEHGTWPESLDELVPIILPAVPADPFSPEGQPLHYDRKGNGYLLYSVGWNGIDEQGQVQTEQCGIFDYQTGDLSLEAIYANQEEPETTTDDAEERQEE